ncbi:MAG: 30S ribosomal protein S17 [Candidatus Micrarchaeota archaeon]|nr:30S ribosomal protein S17 [Candidatus Micrarchaeota archaeon]MCX8154693.1 30S ribosomal protein S17 [Candidatus Micrarchaeota archaeon]
MNDLDRMNEILSKKLSEIHLLPRGQTLSGVVVSNRAKNTVVVLREIVRKIPKYNRYMRSRSKIHAHVPDGVSIQQGDVVEIRETRKISKTKSWIVTKILKRGEIREITQS